jgi:hypothetical protein
MDYHLEKLELSDYVDLLPFGEFENLYLGHNNINT